MDSSSPPLLRHLDALYPLARVLAGPGASRLLTDVYERAAAEPPAERPEDERAWLIQLLTTLHDEADGRYDDVDETDASLDVSYRQAVARATAERKLPVAFAACSPHERFLLALDALEEHPSTVLGSALDISASDAQSVLDEARSSLRAALRDVVNGPERMLMDVALPESTLQSLLEALITDRFDAPSASLRASLSSVIEDAQPEAESPSGAEDTSATNASSLLRRVGVGVLVLLLLGGAMLGLYFTNTTPNSASPLSSFTTQYTTDLSPSVRPATTEEAKQYIQSNWERRLSLPTLRNAPLQGVSSLVLDSVDVPVLLYEDTTRQRPIAVGAYNYALIDRLGSRVTVPDSVRAHLSGGGPPLMRRSEGRPVVLWRNRDDLFVAVGPQGLSPQALRQQITP
jgi:DNA-directed RNA polymerase specialized sigma24 family protein